MKRKDEYNYSFKVIITINKNEKISIIKDIIKKTDKKFNLQLVRWIKYLPFYSLKAKFSKDISQSEFEEFIKIVEKIRTIGYR